MYRLVHTLLFNIKIKNGIHIYKNMNTVYQLIGLYIIICLNTKQLVLFPRFRLYLTLHRYHTNAANIYHLLCKSDMDTSFVKNPHLS